VISFYSLTRRLLKKTRQLTSSPTRQLKMLASFYMLASSPTHELLFASEIRRYLPPILCFPLQYPIFVGIVLQPGEGAIDELKQFFVFVAADQIGFDLFGSDPHDGSE
jgi:hypothetical protein